MDTGMEVILAFETSDQALSGELGELLGNREAVSTAKRAVGGFDVKALFPLLSDLLGRILGFAAKNRERISQSSIIIGKDRIAIQGYGPDDTLKFLESEAVQKAIRAYTKGKSGK